VARLPSLPSSKLHSVPCTLYVHIARYFFVPQLPNGETEKVHLKSLPGTFCLLVTLRCTSLRQTIGTLFLSFTGLALPFRFGGVNVLHHDVSLQTSRSSGISLPMSGPLTDRSQDSAVARVVSKLAARAAGRSLKVMRWDLLSRPIASPEDQDVGERHRLPRAQAEAKRAKKA
jgi:hypothetical protein